jgi:hypothetical protein
MEKTVKIPMWGFFLFSQNIKSTVMEQNNVRHFCRMTKVQMELNLYLNQVFIYDCGVEK